MNNCFGNIHPSDNYTKLLYVLTQHISNGARPYREGKELYIHVRAVDRRYGVYDTKQSRRANGS